MVKKAKKVIGNNSLLIIWVVVMIFLMITLNQ